MSNLRAYILCRFAQESAIYTPWLNRLPMEHVAVEDHLPDWPIPDDAGILITHLHYRWEEFCALRKVVETARVPVLILADGVLEYRNTWEHPDLADGSIFQPLCGHKLACISKGQARVVESWGNPGCCEVVGMPRLDRMLALPTMPTRSEGPFRLLIATANTPAFHPDQRRAVADSLRCLAERIERNPIVNNRPIEVQWRLTDGLETELGLPTVPRDQQPPLSEAIDASDAVITSPSTLYLESIARHRPTAVLDFWNSPTYIPPAWSIAAPAHVNRVLEQLADPPPDRMLFQEAVLLDQLECRSAATPRIIRLIDTMVAAGVAARAEHRSIELPARILPEQDCGFSRVPKTFQLSSLFPNNEAFRALPLQRLQVELSMAIKRLGQLPVELSEQTEQIKKLQQLTAEGLERESKLLDRVRLLHQRMLELREHYGLKHDTHEADDESTTFTDSSIDVGREQS